MIYRYQGEGEWNTGVTISYPYPKTLVSSKLESSEISKAENDPSTGVVGMDGYSSRISGSVTPAKRKGQVLSKGKELQI
jgi:hypothetical protein